MCFQSKVAHCCEEYKVGWAHTTFWPFGLYRNVSARPRAGGFCPQLWSSDENQRGAREFDSHCRGLLIVGSHGQRGDSFISMALCFSNPRSTELGPPADWVNFSACSKHLGGRWHMCQLSVFWDLGTLCTLAQSPSPYWQGTDGMGRNRHSGRCR